MIDFNLDVKTSEFDARTNSIVITVTKYKGVNKQVYKQLFQLRILLVMKELCDKIKWESVRKLDDGSIVSTGCNGKTAFPCEDKLNFTDNFSKKRLEPIRALCLNHISL